MKLQTIRVEGFKRFREAFTISDLHRALKLGWEDFKAVPSHAIILCLIYPVIGLVLARLVHGYSVLPLLFPLAAGFALLGPFAAIGLYLWVRRQPVWAGIFLGLGAADGHGHPRILAS